MTEEDDLYWDEVAQKARPAALSATIELHNTQAAQALIRYFAERLEDGHMLQDPVLFQYLRHAFAKITKEGWSADQAFGLKLRRGQYYRPDTMNRDIASVAYVVLLMRHGWTWIDAISEAANLFISSEGGDKAVTAAYSRYKRTIKDLPEKTLLKILPEGTPVIPRNMNG